MDITDIKYPDHSFEVILCSHVLEHVPDDRKALREFYRVLSPGGWAMIQIPISDPVTFEDLTITDPEERLRLFGQRGSCASLRS
jgi:ubiquinone/menaquinone biosynthesis C-methylase UbiE